MGVEPKNDLLIDKRVRLTTCCHLHPLTLLMHQYTQKSATPAFIRLHILQLDSLPSILSSSLRVNGQEQSWGFPSIHNMKQAGAFELRGDPAGPNGRLHFIHISVEALQQGVSSHSAVV